MYPGIPRPVLFAGLFLFLTIMQVAFTLDSDQGHARLLYVPHDSEIFVFNESKGSLKRFMEMPYRLLASYHQIPGFLFLSAQFAPGGTSGVFVYDLKTQSKEKILDGYFSRIIIDYPYIITFSSSYENGKGFLMTVSMLNGKNDHREIMKIDTGLFPGDETSVDGELFLTGSDRLDSTDLLKLISPKTGKQKTVMSLKKEAGTLKLIGLNDRLLAYYSMTLTGRTTNKAFIVTHDRKKESGWSYTELNVPNNEYVFFGKGCFTGNRIIIPAIDKNKDIHIGIFELKNTSSLSLDKWLRAPTGIYSIHNVSDTSIVFTGYNYFKSKTDFSLVVLDLTSIDDNPFRVFGLGTEEK